MENTEKLSLEQIRAFLQASQEVRFQATRRQEIYEWVTRTICYQEYWKQKRTVKGLLRRYIATMMGLSRAQVTRLIARLVVDENLARHAFGGENAVGRQLWIPAMGAAPVQIAGVVGHVRHWGLAGDDRSRVRDQMYYPFSQVPVPMLRFFSSVMSIAVRTKTPALNAVRPLQQELRGAAGDQALYEPKTMEQLVSASLARQRFLLLLFGIFAGIALLLPSIGIYGVLAYLTGQRVPEIGMRMALGATARDVMGLVLRQCLRMVLVGVGVGIFAALAAGRVLQRLVVGMQPVHAATFALMIPLLLAAALAASFVPARRASRVDPVRALRQG